MKHPHFQQVITREVMALAAKLAKRKEPGRAGRPPRNNLTLVAKELGVGVSTLTHWHNGSSLPRDEQLGNLARRFRQADRSAAEALRAEFVNAKQTDKAADASELRIAGLAYWPLSGTHGRDGREIGSLDTILLRLFQLMHRKYKFEVRSGVDDAEKMIIERKNNAHVCMFDTPDRSAHSRTFHSPVRISINAVMLTMETDDSAMDETRKRLVSLLQPHDQEVDSPDFVAVALRPEVGYLYLQDTVRLKENELRRTEHIASDGRKLDLSASGFAEKLVTTCERYPTKTAYAIVDEFTALRILAVLAEEKRTTPATGNPALVFPLSTQASVRGGLRTSLPAFVTGLATVTAADERLVDTLARGLPMLLDQTEWVSMQYRNLYDRLVREVQRGLDKIKTCDMDCYRRLQAVQAEPVGIEELWNEGCAIQFAKYALRLNSEEPIESVARLNLPWRHIVEKVRGTLPLPQEGTESVREDRLRITYFPMGPVCAPEKYWPRIRQEFVKNPLRGAIDLSPLGFVGRLMHSFQHLADPVEVRCLVPRLILGKDPTPGEARTQETREDVRVGALETYDRARYWKFYRIPFFVPLNAVVLRRDLKAARISMQDLRLAIASEEDGREALREVRRQLRFVVLDAGAGSELFLLENLGFRPDKRRVVRERNAETYKKGLTEKYEAGTVRVLVVQVFNCLNVIKMLGEEDKGELVFDLLGAQNPMPELNAAIAVNRESRMWVDFFDYAFPRLLREEEERLAKLVGELRKDTIDYLLGLSVNDKIKGRLEEVANHFLCLDDAGRNRLPEWERILEKVRQAVQLPTAN